MACKTIKSDSFRGSHRLFADQSTPDKRQKADNQPFIFNLVGMRRASLNVAAKVQ